MPDERTERIARNESVFRELNESIESSVHSKRTHDGLAGFLCECGDGDCEAIVQIALSAYESIRQDSQLFFVVPGHELPDVEDVVDGEDGRYVVVRKHDSAAAIVQETDPRSA